MNYQFIVHCPNDIYAHSNQIYVIIMSEIVIYCLLIENVRKGCNTLIEQSLAVRSQNFLMKQSARELYYD